MQRVKACLSGNSRDRDSLDYTFHWRLCKPPFRRKPDPPLSELPSCFLPTEQGEQAEWVDFTELDVCEGAAVAREGLEA